ncbi:MAG: hypothetical protein GY738_21835 [Pseudoalteromonas sp.]|nr:hypothetical protein [Pseudoalteromonas sp.]
MAAGDRTYIGSGVGDTTTTPPEVGSIMTAEGWTAQDEVGIPHPKTAIPYWGTLAELAAGWVICNGQNGTPDLRSQFIRGASNNGQVGTTHAYTTARPRNTTFATNSDSHYHSALNWNISHIYKGTGTTNTLRDLDTGTTRWSGYVHTGSGTGHGLDFLVRPGDRDTTSTDAHSHNITGGGDSETAPQHIFMYWITYIG